MYKTYLIHKCKGCDLAYRGMSPWYDPTNKETKESIIQVLIVNLTSKCIATPSWWGGDGEPLMSGSGVAI